MSNCLNQNLYCYMHANQCKSEIKNRFYQVEISFINLSVYLTFFSHHKCLIIFKMLMFEIAILKLLARLECNFILIITTPLEKPHRSHMFVKHCDLDSRKTVSNSKLAFPLSTSQRQPQQRGLFSIIFIIITIIFFLSFSS